MEWSLTTIPRLRQKYYRETLCVPGVFSPTTVCVGRSERLRRLELYQLSHGIRRSSHHRSLATISPTCSQALILSSYNGCPTRLSCPSPFLPTSIPCRVFRGSRLHPSFGVQQTGNASPRLLQYPLSIHGEIPHPWPRRRCPHETAAQRVCV